MRRSRGSGNPVSLFPFLAVLVSAMGALILLLLVVSRQAQRTRDLEYKQKRGPSVYASVPMPPLPEAEEYPLPPPVPPIEPPPLVRPELPPLPTIVDRRAELESRRIEAARAVAIERATLENAASGPLPEESRIVELRATVDGLRQDKSSLDRELAAIVEKLAKLTADRKSAEEDLQRARLTSMGTENKYAIVPYFGPNATSRRPIYFECRYDRIVLMPEGVEIGADLLADPTRPDNALARVVRALCQMHRSEGERPYPLLVVRPDGIAAFYVARSALATIEDDFGYELVDNGVSIEFGPTQAKSRDIAASVIREESRRAGYGASGARRAFSLESTLPPGAPKGILTGTIEPGFPGGDESGRAQGADPRKYSRVAAMDDAQLAAAARRLAPIAGLDSPPRGNGLGNGRNWPSDRPLALPPLEPVSTPGGGLAQPQDPDAATLRSEVGTGAPMPPIERLDGLGSSVRSSDQTDGDQVNASRGGDASGQRSIAKLRAVPGSKDDSIKSHRSNGAQPTGSGVAGGAGRPRGDKQESSDAASQPMSEFELYVASMVKGSGAGGAPPMPTEAAQTASDATSRGETSGSAGEGGGASASGVQALLPMIGPKVSTNTSMPRRVVVEIRHEGVVLHPGKRFVPFAGEPSMSAIKQAIYQHVATQVMSWGKPKKGDRWTPIVELDVRPDALDRYYDLRFALAGSGLDMDRRLIGWKDEMDFAR